MYYILANGECKPQDIIYILLQLPVLSAASVSQTSQLAQISGNLIKKSLTSLQMSPASDNLTSQRIFLLAEITASLFNTKYSRPLSHHRNIVWNSYIDLIILEFLRKQYKRQAIFRACAETNKQRERGIRSVWRSPCCCVSGAEVLLEGGEAAC